MFKFLRKYNKWILAVGGVLLMIVFLVPQAITSMSQSAAVGSAVWATVGPDDADVSAKVRRRCEAELELLDQISRTGVRLGITNDPAHWYLLTREAERAGLIGGRAADQISPDLLARIASVVGATQMLDETIGRSLGVGRMLQMYHNAGELSDHRLRTEARRLFTVVNGRAVILEATARDDAPRPTEEAVAVQFESFKDVAPGTTTEDDGRGFGYRLPDRFHVEWITVPTDSIREMLENGDAINTVALFKHWQQNKLVKGFPEVDPEAEIPPRVRQDLLAGLTVETADAIQKFVGDRLLNSWRPLRTVDGYYELPEEWAQQRVDMSLLALEIQEAFPGLALPVYESISDRWLTTDDVATLPGLGTAVTSRYGTTPTTAATLIGAAREFGGNMTMLVQEGIALPPLRDRLDDGVVGLRITGTDPSRPPANVDEVRDLVVADLRREADFADLRGRVDALEQQARSQGLLAVALENDTAVRRLNSISLSNPTFVDFQLQNNVPLQTTPTRLPVVGAVVGANTEAVEAIVDRALALGQDVPLADLPRDRRTFVLPVADAMAVMVIELDSQVPLDRERFDRLASFGALQRMLLGDELGNTSESLVDAFAFDAMAARHNFKLAAREDATTQPDDQADGQETGAPEETAAAR